MHVEPSGSGFDAASAGCAATVAFPACASSVPSDDCALDETVPIRRHSANAVPNRVARITGVWCRDPKCIGGWLSTFYADRASLSSRECEPVDSMTFSVTVPSNDGDKQPRGLEWSCTGGPWSLRNIGVHCEVSRISGGSIDERRSLRHSGGHSRGPCYD